MTRIQQLLLRSDVRVIASVGLLGFGFAVFASLARGGIPAAHVHDEFSYLLASDTFAHGRLTNPTHPMWEFFETFHVLQQPTYASKYPPAQGLLLALGQVTTGAAIAGVWLSYGLMCAALTWMLLAWVNRRWALYGGAAAALFLMGFHADRGNWGASYWGGAVAALGGALMFGAVGRLTTRASVPLAIWLALGVGILANSRPFEGLLLCVPVALYLLAWLIRGRQQNVRWRMRTVVVPAALVLAGVGGAMAFYNARVTGSPLTMPYLVYEKAYGSSAIMLFGRWKVLEYRHLQMKQFYETQPTAPTSATVLLQKVAGNFSTYRAFYFPAFIVVLVFLGVAVVRDRRMWLPLAAIGSVTAGLLMETWSFGHYAAPVVAPLLLVAIGSARRLNLLAVGRARLGQQMLAIVAVGIVASAFAYPAFRIVASGRYENKWFEQRDRMLERLESDGGRHLVIVHYQPTHDTSEEWVYNRADIDASPVVWARSLGSRDSTLVQYFRDRQVWTVDVDHANGPALVRAGVPGGR